MGKINFLGGQPADWGLNLLDDIGPFVLMFFALLGSVGVAYAIYLGIQLAKSDDDSKRQQAKSRIIKTVVGLFLVLVLTTTLFNPAFYNAILRGTTDRGDRSVKIRGIPMNSNGQYEFAINTQTSLNLTMGPHLSYDSFSVIVTRVNSPNQAAARIDTRNLQQVNIPLAEVIVNSETGAVSIIGVEEGDGLITITVINGGSRQNFRFPIAIIAQDDWVDKYPYGIQFNANNGSFALGEETNFLFGLSATDKLTQEQLMNVLEPNGNFANDTSLISRTWHERIGWTSLERTQANAVGDRDLTAGGTAIARDFVVGNMLGDSSINRSEQNGITVFDVHAYWMDTRRADDGNTGPPDVIPLPPGVPPGGTPPGGTPPGGSDPVGPPPGWGPTVPPYTPLGPVWGQNSAGTHDQLPNINHYDYRGKNGGGCKHPSTYQPTDHERIMLARAIRAEADDSWGRFHQIAVGEVIMRRVMCGTNDSMVRNRNTIYDTISAPGQYAVWVPSTGQILGNRSTEQSSEAAAVALRGITNYSGGRSGDGRSGDPVGRYFQHRGPGGYGKGPWYDVVWLQRPGTTGESNRRPFSNNRVTAGWSCRCARRNGTPAPSSTPPGGPGNATPFWIGLETSFNNLFRKRLRLI